MHPTRGGVDASPGGVRSRVGPARGAAAEAAAEAGEACLDEAAGVDPARFEHVDERAADRPDVADGRVARAASDSRVQRAGVRVVAPSFRGRATPPDLE